MRMASSILPTSATAAFSKSCLQQAGAWWVWLTLMATAIQITSCLTRARDRRRYGILTTTFSAPACLGLLFLLAGAWQGKPTLMATAIQSASCLTQARSRRRYGILTTTFSAPACLGQPFLLAGAW